MLSRIWVYCSHFIPHVAKIDTRNVNIVRRSWQNTQCVFRVFDFIFKTNLLGIGVVVHWNHVALAENKTFIGWVELRLRVRPAIAIGWYEITSMKSFSVIKTVIGFYDLFFQANSDSHPAFDFVDKKIKMNLLARNFWLHQGKTLSIASRHSLTRNWANYFNIIGLIDSPSKANVSSWLNNMTHIFTNFINFIFECYFSKIQSHTCKFTLGWRHVFIDSLLDGKLFLYFKFI